MRMISPSSVRTTDEVCDAVRSNPYALLLGRKTYDGFAAAWPSIEDEHGFAERMNGLPKYVVSSTLADPTWNATAIGLEEIETPSDFTLVSAVPSEQVVLVTLAKH